MKRKLFKSGTGNTKKRLAAVVILLLTAVFAFCCRVQRVESLTYAVYPYLPDVEYYEELIEKRWAELEPNIRLLRAEWNCYDAAAPEGIDVIMYDSFTRDTLIEAGWIQPFEKSAVLNRDDIYTFALDGLTVDDRLYGIPVFLCGNFLIYDKACSILAEAEHITELAGESELLVISSEDSGSREQLTLEILADTLSEPNPAKDSGSADAIMLLIDRLAIEEHKEDSSGDLALAYDHGIGSGYISFSETMRFLDRRISDTDIKAISFSDRENVPRLYVDAAALSSRAEGKRKDKALELMNVMAEAELLSELSVQEGAPQYLLLARPSSYEALVNRFPLYRQLENIARDEKNCVILSSR